MSKKPIGTTEETSAASSPLQEKFLQGWERLMRCVAGIEDTKFSVSFNESQVFLTGDPGLEEVLHQRLMDPTTLRDEIGYLLVPVIGSAAASADVLAPLILPKTYTPEKNGVELFQRAFSQLIENGFLPATGWRETPTAVELTFTNRQLGIMQLELVRKALSQASRTDIMQAFAAEQYRPLPLPAEPTSKHLGPLSPVLDSILATTNDDGNILTVAFNLKRLYACLQPPEITVNSDHVTVDKDKILAFLGFIYGASRIPVPQMAGGNGIDLISWADAPLLPKPIRYTFILDTSESMISEWRGSGVGTPKSYKSSIIEALKVLIDGTTSEGDVVCFSPFSNGCALPEAANANRPKSVQKKGYAEFPLNSSTLLQQVSAYLDNDFDAELRKAGGTRLTGAVADHLNLISSDTKHQHTLVILTDGCSNINQTKGTQQLADEYEKLAQVVRKPKAFIIACGPGVSNAEIEKIRKPLDGHVITASDPTALATLSAYADELAIGREIFQLIGGVNKRFCSVYDRNPVVLEDVATTPGQSFLINDEEFVVVAPPSAPQAVNDENEAVPTSCFSVLNTAADGKTTKSIPQAHR